STGSTTRTRDRPRRGEHSTAPTANGGGGPSPRARGSRRALLVLQEAQQADHRNVVADTLPFRTGPGRSGMRDGTAASLLLASAVPLQPLLRLLRSEERRVGKEWRTRTETYAEAATEQ